MSLCSVRMKIAASMHFMYESFKFNIVDLACADPEMFTGEGGGGEGWGLFSVNLREFNKF